MYCRLPDIHTTLALPSQSLENAMLKYALLTFLCHYYWPCYKSYGQLFWCHCYDGTGHASMVMTLHFTFSQIRTLSFLYQVGLHQAPGVPNTFWCLMQLLQMHIYSLSFTGCPHEFWNPAIFLKIILLFHGTFGFSLALTTVLHQFCNMTSVKLKRRLSNRTFSTQLLQYLLLFIAYLSYEAELQLHWWAPAVEVSHPT